MYGPRGLRLAGRAADGWIPSLGYMGPEAFSRASATIDEAAVKAGRDPDEIRRIYNLSGAITDGPRGDDHLTGPVEHWVSTLSRWATEIGVDSFIFWPPDGDLDQVHRFAEEVTPAVRRAAAR